ncbi:Protein flp [Pseudocercospora fuligena]|uniref:Protein flp n=1 Tax=Pseudocercospora fuligena TaxID=685502 RepID=A0A8H6R8V5_9PEZI|nr:Protein flp [Pseudocercospora fuligena]
MDLFNSTDFDAHVNDLISEWNIPGLAIAISQSDDVRSKGFGLATLEPPKPCTPDTIFDLASSSKSLTAASVGLLIADEEKYPNVTWTAKMHDLLPEDFVMSEDSYTKDITVEDTLGHRTGLPRHDLSYFGVRSNHTDTPKSVTRNLRNLQLNAPIRTKYQYNNIFYTVATHLVETTTGETFSDFLQNNFFGPLNMSDTHLQPDASKAAGLGDRLATPYHWVEESKAYRAVPYQQCPEAQGAGSVMTSVNDYIKWVRALMFQHEPITKEVFEGITSIRIPIDPDVDDEDRHPFTSFEGYATGLGVKYYRGAQIISHDGGVPGFGSTHLLMPEHDFGLVVLGNTGEAGTICDVVAMELIDAMLKLPQSERVDWLARAKAIREKYEKEEKEDSVSKQLMPDLEEPEPLKMPLETYAGNYWNVEYQGIKIQIKDGKLFIDASDRSMGFYLTLEHLKDQTLFEGKMEDYFDGSEGEMAAEFKFVNDNVVKLGLDMESDLGHYIWFDKVEESSKSLPTR